MNKKTTNKIKRIAHLLIAENQDRLFEEIEKFLLRRFVEEFSHRGNYEGCDYLVDATLERGDKNLGFTFSFDRKAIPSNIGRKDIEKIVDAPRFLVDFKNAIGDAIEDLQTFEAFVEIESQIVESDLGDWLEEEGLGATREEVRKKREELYGESSTFDYLYEELSFRKTFIPMSDVILKRGNKTIGKIRIHWRNILSTKLIVF